MKTFMITALLALSAVSHAQTIAMKPVWETDTTLRTPESVLYDPAGRVLYVACINGQPNAENKGSYVAKVGLDGKVKTLRFTDGLNATKGMGILGDKLYVTELTQVAEIALATGKIVNRYPIPDAKFLNDIAVDVANKTIYLTDMRSNAIWAITNGAARKVLDGAPLTNPNGLLFENGQLLIGNGDGQLLVMTPATNAIKTVAKGMGGIDGIAGLGGNRYVVTEWGGKVWYIGADGKTELKLDTSAEKINSADVGYNPVTQTLYVPTFFHNTVKAYSLK